MSPPKIGMQGSSCRSGDRAGVFLWDFGVPVSLVPQVPTVHGALKKGFIILILFYCSMMDGLPLLLGSIPVSHQRPSPAGDPAGVIVTGVPGAGAVRS